MAEILRYFVSIDMADGILRPCGNTFYIGDADAEEYITAADDTERAASKVGILVAKYVATTDAAFVSTRVGIEVLNDPITNAADTILRGNKVDLSYRSGGRGSHFTIPARKASAYTQESDSLKINIGAAGALKDFITAYEDTVVNAYGLATDVISARIVD